MSFFFSFPCRSLPLSPQKKKLSHHQVRPARLEQLEHLVQRRHIQDVLHAVGTSNQVAASAILQGDDRADLDLVVRVDEDQVLCVEDADDVLAVPLPDRDAGVACFLSVVCGVFFWCRKGGGARKAVRKGEGEKLLFIFWVFSFKNKTK